MPPRVPDPAPTPAAGRPNTLGDDILKRLAEHEAEGRVDDLDSLAGILEAPREQLARSLEQLVHNGWVERTGPHYAPTDAGRALGLHLLRSHRLLETRFARETGLAPAEWHTTADRAEHVLTVAEANILSDSLGNPRFDPHGDPIPDRDGRFSTATVPTLLDWPEGQPALIVHLEDEPPALFAALHAFGLSPGLIVRYSRPKPDVVELTVAGRTLKLSLGEAELIHVAAPAPERVAAVSGRRRLTDLTPGETGTISALGPVIRGQARQRLLDLGLVPGTRIAREFEAAWASPVAYRVRGTLVALRTEQAEHILLEAADKVPTP